jgi:tetratricopeptide (TPR) repeat protein
MVALTRLEEALAAYRRCVELTSWDEEKYMALLRIGRILVEQKHIEEALVSFLLAHEAFSGRSEAAYEAGRIFNTLNLRRRAIEILSEGASRCPQSGILLIEKWICQWGIETELGSAYWWAGDSKSAKSIFEKTLQKPNLPESAIELIKTNLSYCS